jgi:hypothetical protein
LQLVGCLEICPVLLEQYPDETQAVWGWRVDVSEVWRFYIFGLEAKVGGRVSEKVFPWLVAQDTTHVRVVIFVPFPNQTSPKIVSQLSKQSTHMS